MATLATLLTQLRLLARDTPISNKSVRETPQGINDGSNTRFKLQNPILFTISAVPQIWWSSGSTYRSQTGITIDDVNMGLITINPAPSVGTQNAPFQVDYFYYHLADADYTEFLNDGARDLLAIGDPTTIADGLLSALLQYALGHAYQARATQYATRYSSSGGQAGQSVDVVTKNFTTLSKNAFDEGKRLRDEYYERLGQREAPATAVATFKIDPITPPR